MLSIVRPFMRFYNLTLSPDRIFARRLRNMLGFAPARLGTFKLAFSHRSGINEESAALHSNERLEYLGDAVLGTIIAEYLFKKYPNADEGFLTKMRSKIVQRKSLNTLADRMGLDEYLTEYNNMRLSRSMMGNALEALVGAIYLEIGYHRTAAFIIRRVLMRYVDVHELETFDDNYKSQLLEHCQKLGQSVSYKTLAKYKLEKRDCFKVAVLIDGQKMATADDFNKKSAEQSASKKALETLGLASENPTM